MIFNIVYECPKCKRDTIGVFPKFLRNSFQGVRYNVTCEHCIHETEIALEPIEHLDISRFKKDFINLFFLN
jgi:hypothetical protein